MPGEKNSKIIAPGDGLAGQHVVLDRIRFHRALLSITPTHSGTRRAVIVDRFGSSRLGFPRVAPGRTRHHNGHAPRLPHDRAARADLRSTKETYHVPGSNRPANSDGAETRPAARDHDHHGLVDGCRRRPERRAARGRRGQEDLRRQDHHHRLGSRPAVARSEELLRPEVGAAHRLQGEGGRGADRRDVHQDHAGVPRRHRRLRRAQRDPGLDARPGAGRRARAARPATSTSTASATSCRRSRRPTATTR